MRRLIRAAPVLNQEEAVINLTPLIDVVFVILIMFIVVAPLLEKDIVELAVAGPQSEEVSATLQEKYPISIHVKSDNTIWYNKQRVSVEELSALLTKAHIQFPKAKPLVYHDKRAQFGTYQLVKNCAEGAGFTEMDIILSPS